LWIIKSPKLQQVNRVKKILYADDDLDDKTWVSEASQLLDYSLDIDFVENGREVFEYLKNYLELPALIVLDLNMPELDGRQTLQKLKTSPKYKDIPVVIVTTSSNKIDMEICSRLGASLYLVKPDSHSEWQQIVKNLVPYIS
jgi:CheY-like chemotaxis protein